MTPTPTLLGCSLFFDTLGINHRDTEATEPKRNGRQARNVNADRFDGAAKRRARTETNGGYESH